jgi:hypothetical protein
MKESTINKKQKEEMPDDTTQQQQQHPQLLQGKSPTVLFPVTEATRSFSYELALITKEAVPSNKQLKAVVFLSFFSVRVWVRVFFFF